MLIIRVFFEITPNFLVVRFEFDEPINEPINSDEN